MNYKIIISKSTHQELRKIYNISRISPHLQKIFFSYKESRETANSLKIPITKLILPTVLAVCSGARNRRSARDVLGRRGDAACSVFLKLSSIPPHNAPPYNRWTPSRQCTARSSAYVRTFFDVSLCGPWKGLIVKFARVKCQLDIFCFGALSELAR